MPIAPIAASSALAVEGAGSVGDGGSRAASVVRNLDLVLLALALPVFVVAGLSMTGYAVIAGVWLAQFAVEVWARRRVERELEAGHRRDAMGWTAATGLGRVYMVTTAVLLVGLIDEREAGLAAAVLALALFTVHFGGRFIARRLEGEEGRI